MKKKVKIKKMVKASNKAEDIIDIILRDHEPLKELLETLKDDDIEREEKEPAYKEFFPMLLSHAKAEEQSLYVQMKEFDDLRMKSFEGDVEHSIADQLIHEINGTSDEDEWNAKVKVLAELVEHHIEEEEEEMLKAVEEQIDITTRRAVGELYSELKTELDQLSRDRPLSRKNSLEYRVL